MNSIGDRTYDWIVIGNGVTGAAVSYELARVGFRVLLVERHVPLQEATRYSYGGIAYWSATTPVNRQLCQDAIHRYPQLSEELGADIEFRELDLVLTIDPERDPEQAVRSYADCFNPPSLVTAKDACELEPLLNPAALGAALTVKHGHVNPEAMVNAYNDAFKQAGGVVHQAEVKEFLREGDRIQGVVTDSGTLHADQVLVAAGGLTRSLLLTLGLSVRQYFTHAELIETPPLDLKLRSLVMPADLQRFDLEAEASSPDVENLWDDPGREVVPPILDPGAVQFLDGRLRIGQMSRTLTDPDATVDAFQSEQDMRLAISTILPALRDVPGTWHHCRVAFTGDRLPLMGAIPGCSGLSVFSGFSNPFAVLPSLARRFAAHLSGSPDPIVASMAPDRPNLLQWR